MKYATKGLLLASLLLLAAGAAADDAYLRLRCTGDSEGAEVKVNGARKGACPIDVAVPAGDIALSATKDLGRGQYRLYSTEFFLDARASRRIDIVLGADVHFTEEGRQLEDERLAEEKAAAAQAAAAVAEQQAAVEAARQQARRQAADAAAAKAAEPGMVKWYTGAMSSKDPTVPPSAAFTYVLFSPLYLPMSTVTDITQGKSIASMDPAVFARPESMVARAAGQQPAALAAR